jgi:DNA-binding CsgD family transcriptional regulator
MMKLDRALAAGVSVIALFNAISGLTMPVADRRPSIGVVAMVFVVLVAHGALYWFGDRVRNRHGLIRYFAAQGALVFAIAASGSLFPVGFGLYLALTTQAVLLANGTMGSMTITLAAIVLFAINAMVANDLYRGSTAGLLLAVTGVIAHAIAALLRRSEPTPAVATGPAPAALSVNGNGSGLTSRELEVLGALAAGARNTQIATDLGIAERTVKAHLASIYQKLGVESRGAAVATARTRGILQ